MANNPIQLRLYTSGKSPNSINALKNLIAIYEEQLSPDSHVIEVIDLFLEPLRAIEDGVMLTPMLVIMTKSPVSIIGDLSDTADVLELILSGNKANGTS